MNVEPRTSNAHRRMKDETFMKLALSLAEEALAAGEFPVGCVFVHGDRVVARGGRIGSSGTANEIDHAEIMALREFYTQPPSCNPKNIIVYSTLEPCLMCFGALVIAGIGRIVYAYEDDMGGGCQCRLTHLPEFYRDRVPAIIPHVLRAESLALFQSFFRNPESTYLKGSHLAAYTLAQNHRKSDLPSGQI